MRAVNCWSVTALTVPLALLVGTTLALGWWEVVSELEAGFWRFALVLIGWTMLPAGASLASYVHSRKRVISQAALRAELVAIVVSIPVLLGLALLLFLGSVSGIV
jgi:hypothetical protein